MLIFASLNYIMLYYDISFQQAEITDEMPIYVGDNSITLLRRLLVWFILRPCQHDNGYIDGRSQIKVHTDERTQVHSTQPSLAVTHPGTNRARRYLTSVIESPSKHWSPPRTSKKANE